MNRAVAVFVLCLFAAGAVAIAWWGYSDVVGAKQAMRACVSPVTLDVSAFWFLGLISVAFFPALAVVKERYHRFLFWAAMATVFAVPLGSFQQFKSLAQTQSYDISALPSPSSLKEFELLATGDCQAG